MNIENKRFEVLVNPTFKKRAGTSRVIKVVSMK